MVRTWSNVNALVDGTYTMLMQLQQTQNNDIHDWRCGVHLLLKWFNDVCCWSAEVGWTLVIDKRKQELNHKGFTFDTMRNDYQWHSRPTLVEFDFFLVIAIHFYDATSMHFLIFFLPAKMHVVYYIYNRFYHTIILYFVTWYPFPDTIMLFLTFELNIPWVRVFVNYVTSSQAMFSTA